MLFRKIVKMSPFVILTLLNLYALNAHADGGMSGGGGDVIVDPKTGKLVLADPYLDLSGEMSHELGCSDQDRYRPTGAVREELKKMSRLLAAYGAVSAPRTWIAPDLGKCAANEFPKGCRIDFESEQLRSAFVESEVLGVNPVYCLVSRLPARTGTLPLDPSLSRESILVGYTTQRFTFLQESIFNTLSPREQAKLLIHERMHALSSSPSYATIANVTIGLETAMNLAEIQLSTYPRSPSLQEIVALKRLREGIVTSGLVAPVSIHSHIHDYGGGLVADGAKVAPGAFVSVGSAIGANISADAGSQFFFSDVCQEAGYQSLEYGTIQFDSGSYVKNSSLMHCIALLPRLSAIGRVSKNAQILSSMLFFESESGVFPRSFVMEQSAILSGVRANPQYLVLHSGAAVKNSRIYGYESFQSRILESGGRHDHPGLYLELGGRSQLLNAYLLQVAAEGTTHFLSFPVIHAGPYILKIKDSAVVDLSEDVYATGWENMPGVALGPLYPTAYIHSIEEIRNTRDMKKLIDGNAAPIFLE
ncbi:hypothetical protein WDW37_03895 [Bdellovibrionota bacterium FG-1]